MTGWREEFAGLMERAGLEIVGDWPRDEDVLAPRAAWRPVAAMGTEPAATVRCDRPDLVAAVNAQWHRLAVEYGVIGADGVFLVDVADSRSGRRCWVRVRLGATWDLAGVLGERPGRPEFVTAAVDGESLLGVTCEEYEVRLVAVERVRERQEEAARNEARETPEEREAAWTSLFEGPIRPTEKLRAGWREWLGFNRAVPEDVLVRLLDSAADLLWRKDLPPGVVDAAVGHPDPTVRAQLAEVRHPLTAGQWTRLVLGEPGAARRALLAEDAVRTGAELTAEGYERLAGDASALVRAEAARFPALPGALRAALAADPDARVRAAACTGWEDLAPPAREALLDDADSGVRVAALLRHHATHPLPRSVFEEQGFDDEAVETCRLERGFAEYLCRHEDAARRRSVARNPHLDPDLVAVLAEDDDNVRFLVSVRPELTEEQRAAVRAEVDPDGVRHTLPWVHALHDDPEAMRRCAASSHLLLRSSAARAKRLPPDVVERLARDEDRVVRLFLAESCDDAPASMLLEVWLWWNGSLSFPGRPRTHPNFPRRDLLRYADDPHHRLRQLALDDPDSTRELVERFSRDPHWEVRRRAAEDPRLSAASAVRLLDDPRDGVRLASIRHARLPARTLVRLLRDLKTFRDALVNPTLPVAVMRRMAEPGL
ncbi:PE-PGRS family protein [Streptomyces sp. NPDC096153]|uniref:PE-PGRS family protein n=1 Tax=Streptomyces sp. NPDC096153 TaxID=3155548 RepID=UPI003325CC56